MKKSPEEKKEYRDMQLYNRLIELPDFKHIKFVEIHQLLKKWRKYQSSIRFE
jgi:hypothetical protein